MTYQSWTTTVYTWQRQSDPNLSNISNIWSSPKLPYLAWSYCTCPIPTISSEDPILQSNQTSHLFPLNSWSANTNNVEGTPLSKVVKHLSRSRLSNALSTLQWLVLVHNMLACSVDNDSEKRTNLTTEKIGGGTRVLFWGTERLKWSLNLTQMLAKYEFPHCPKMPPRPWWMPLTHKNTERTD